MTVKESYHENKKLVPPSTRLLAARHALNFKPVIINARTLPPLPPEASVSIVSFLEALTRYNEEDPQNAVREIVLMFKNSPGTLHVLRNFRLLLRYASNVYDFKFKILAEQVELQMPEKFRRFIMTAAKRLQLEGREIGRKEGLEKGIKLGIENTARNMLALGKSLEETIEVTGLTHEQLTEAGILFG